MINLKPIFFIFILISSLNIFSQDSIILNYEDVDIKKVSQDIARFSKKTIILDPRVKGKITIYSNANLNSEQVWDVYLRTIQVNGFSTIEQDGFLRVVPENEATRDNTIDISDGSFETAVIPLVNRSSEEILPMIKPITGRQSHLSSISSINSILLVDRASNVARVKNLLADLDKNNTAEISIIKLDNMSSIEAVRILDKLKTQNNPTINQFVAIPFTPSNSVIVSANDLITQNISTTLSALDKDVSADDLTDVIYSGASAGSWISLYMAHTGDPLEIPYKLIDIDYDKISSVFELQINLKNMFLTSYNEDNFNMEKIFVWTNLS